MKQLETRIQQEVLASMHQQSGMEVDDIPDQTGFTR